MTSRLLSFINKLSARAFKSKAKLQQAGQHAQGECRSSHSTEASAAVILEAKAAYQCAKSQSFSNLEMARL